jgi:hypothetical protein
MHGSTSKIHSKNLVRQCCAERFNSGVKGLIAIQDAASADLLILNSYCSLTSILLVHICLHNHEYISFSNILVKDV